MPEQLPIGEIKLRYFLTPLEAIAVIGPKSYGSGWTADLPYDHPAMKIALRNLYASLQSGRVAAHYHASDGHERTLTAVMASNEFFRIDLHQNCCLFGPIVGPPCELKINREDLEKYLHSHTSLTTQGKISDERKCESLLLKKFSGAPIGMRYNKNELYQEIKQEIPALSNRAFERSKAAAVKNLDRPDLFQAGRPRRTEKN